MKKSLGEDQTIEYKQEYLRKEIMENNYDPQEFVNYFQEKNDSDDMDLDYVHFQELIEIVENFKKFSNSGKHAEKRKSKDETEKEKEKLKLNELKTDDNSTKNENLITTNLVLTEENHIEEMILCNKIEKSPLTGIHHLTIDVGNPIVIKGGIFNSDYAVYCVKTPIIHAEVKRRFRDFEWLWTELRHFFPGVFVSKNFKFNYNLIKSIV